MLEFGNRHVEMAAQAVLEAAENLTFVFERLRVGKIKFQGEQADGHVGNPQKRRQKPQAVAAMGATRSITKHSSESPTFTSLKFDTPMPHSKPVRTSVASSLKRFSD